MKRIARRARTLMVIMGLFLIGMTVFLADLFTNAKAWVVHPANQDLYKKGELASSGKIVSSDGTVLLTLDKNGTKYADEKFLREATLHIVGDIKGNILTGVLNKNKTQLIGYNLLNGLFHAGEGGNTVKLTVNADLNKVAYDALGNYNGTVGVYNYKTGEILCMVSKPSYDPKNPPNLQSNYYEGVYINRLTNGLYPPGSIMKVITTQAAIETIPNIYQKKFTCNGGTTINGEFIKCTGNHGTIGLKEGLAVSCNAVYGQLGVQLGPETMMKYATKAGFTQSYTISGVDTTKGRFDVTGAAKIQQGWAAIGQYTDMANPMHFMIYMGAIANGGQAVTPYYIESIKSKWGIPSFFKFDKKVDRMMEEDVAAQLKKLMRNNTKVTYNDASFKGMNLCAKTGTAEVENGKAPHSWFVGFLDNAETPLAFVVLAEHGYSSNTSIPIARTVLKEAVKIE